MKQYKHLIYGKIKQIKRNINFNTHKKSLEVKLQGFLAESEGFEPPEV